MGDTCNRGMELMLHKLSLQNRYLASEIYRLNEVHASTIQAIHQQYRDGEIMALQIDRKVINQFKTERLQLLSDVEQMKRELHTQANAITTKLVQIDSEYKN